MNILITLPKHLIERILSGEKKYEMRKCLPKNMKLGEDGFFVVEKGTDKIRCWCRVDRVMSLCMNPQEVNRFAEDLCVSPQFIFDYAHGRKEVWLWKIGKVVELKDLHRKSLCIDKNPQQYTYTPLSYGEAF